MSHWCLRNVNYDALDFIGDTNVKSEEAPDRTLVGGNAGAFCVQTELEYASEPGSMEYQRGRKDGGEVSSGQSKSVQLLRSALRDAKSHELIAGIIKDWPFETLRLSELITPEECDRSFSEPNQLWTHIFRGLVLMTRTCRLTCLDFTGFVPSKEMIYTYLQLVPYLTLDSKSLSCSQIIDLVRSDLGDLCDEELMRNVDKFIRTFVGHRVLTSGQRINLPNGRLDIILDFSPISSDTLSIMCLVIANAIARWTQVRIQTRSFAVRFDESGGKLFSSLPLLPLKLITRCLPSNNGMDGISMEWNGCPTTGRAVELLQTLEEFIQTRISLAHFNKLMIAYCNIDLNIQHHVSAIKTILSRLVNLTRVDLSGTNIAGKLTLLLENIPGSGLEYLNLSYCSIELSDVDGLFSSSHVQTLRDLDLSYVFSPDCELCKHRRTTSGLRRFSQPRNKWTRSTPRSVSLSTDGSDSMESNDALYSSSNVTVTTETVDLWMMWNLLSPREEQRYQLDLDAHVHKYDQLLVERIFSQLDACRQLTLLDLSNDCLVFRVGLPLLNSIVDSIGRLQYLKHLGIEDIPLWNDDLLRFIQAAVAWENIQSLALTRSRDAPHAELSENVAFWNRVHEIKSGKRIKISIGNFAASTWNSEDVRLASVPSETSEYFTARSSDSYTGME